MGLEFRTRQALPFLSDNDHSRSIGVPRCSRSNTLTGHAWLHNHLISRTLLASSWLYSCLPVARTRAITTQRYIGRLLSLSEKRSVCYCIVLIPTSNSIQTLPVYSEGDALTDADSRSSCVTSNRARALLPILARTHGWTIFNIASQIRKDHEAKRGCPSSNQVQHGRQAFGPLVFGQRAPAAHYFRLHQPRREDCVYCRIEHLPSVSRLKICKYDLYIT
jgi:hypothetical protein